MPAGYHGSYIHHLGLDVCFDEYNYHDSLQACLIVMWNLGSFIHCLELDICFDEYNYYDSLHACLTEGKCE